MHTAAIPLLALMLSLAVASCRAADATPPASAPGTLQASAKVVQNGDGCSLEITLSNPTDHALAMGRYTGFVLTRTDVTPASVVAKSPEHAMAPHFRIVIAPGKSRTSTVPLKDNGGALRPGTYHVQVTFPRDVLPQPVEADFSIAPPATAPAQP